MQLSIEEVKKLDSNSYQIIDIRSEEEVAHGAIKGALNIQAERPLPPCHPAQGCRR